VFVRCSFISSLEEEIIAGEGEEVMEDFYLSAMEENLKAWFSQRVESVLVDNALDLENEYVFSILYTAKLG
jgi:hypothetical protein